MGLRSASSAINVFVHLLRCLGRALSSTANILETNTITGASSEDLQVRKSEGKKKTDAMEHFRKQQNSSWLTIRTGAVWSRND